MRLIQSFLTAFSMYSRIPVPQPDWTRENRQYAMCFFPMIGAAVGFILWGWLRLCDALHIGILLRGAVSAVIPLLITGGIHMDGFLDTSDAMASWQPKEKRLEVLKDHHVGAFAVMACICYLLLNTAVYAEMPAQSGPMLIGICMTSRALSALALLFFRKARPGGILDGFAAAAHRQTVFVAVILYCAVSIGLWAVCGGWIAVVCAAVAIICFAYYRHMAYMAFGGVTGDLAGWFLQVAELAMAFVIVLGRRFL